MTTESRPPDLDDEPPGRLRALFDAALEQPAESRADWLAAQAVDADEQAAVQRLLASEAAPSLLDTAATVRAARIGLDEETGAEGLIGQRIGAFRLLRLLGQGGMATVFLGQREEAGFVQQVAIKLLRRGLYSEVEQRMFRRERQALAMLSHPNIAHLIDGGVTEAGIPYLVMDYIDGMPITQYVTGLRLDPGASPRQALRTRLRLFLVVCHAVEAAHRQLIVHRDLKPSNILVTDDGTVKLLDFGIAKLLDEDDGATGTGLSALTPGYAAPEQYSGGAITTATDVYALGVLLHELLLGVRPEEPGTGTTKRPSLRVAEARLDERTMPASKPELQAALRGDLDNIVLKALAGEPERRYASAGAFADDIERHLGGHPVAAHPPSRWYRTRKFVLRHRGSVATTTVFLLAILASLGLALWQTRVAHSERTLRFEDAERLYAETNNATYACFLEPASTCRQRFAELHAASARALGRTDPLTLRILWDRVKANTAAGDYTQAKPLSQQLVELDRARFGDSHPRTLTAITLLADICNRLGDYAEAEKLLTASLPLAERSLGREHPVMADMLLQYGLSQHLQHRPAEAEAALERASVLLTKLEGPNGRKARDAQTALLQVRAKQAARAERH